MYMAKIYSNARRLYKNEFGIIAEPDYYIRNGNKIFLFESKDILIPSETKVSNDYENISSELKKRLYYEEKGMVELIIKQCFNY